MKSLSCLLRTRSQYINKINCGAYSTISTNKKKIEIPNRIPRGPTDILQALASTVKIDPTAPHFKYHDDPYLIPMSNVGKRTFALAQEAGRKTAHWIRQEHSDLFQHSVADPPIKSFLPTIHYDENSDVTEDDLKNIIKDVFVSDAVIVYNLLKTKGVGIADETKQSLLELLAFHNSVDTLSEELIEERWFQQGVKGKDRLRKTWKDGGTAEEVFNSIKEPNSQAYCAIIQGMTKYCQADRAWELYQQSQERGIALSTVTFNSLLKVTSFLKEGHDMRWTFIKDLLLVMVQQEVAPNIGTLNAVLETLNGMSGYRYCKQLMLSTISEFKALGIEPSLGSWYHVMTAFSKDRGTTNPVLLDIMNHIENKEFQIVDIKDTFFFVTAMDLCRNYLQDKDLAHRIHNLLHTGNNYDLIGDSFKESIYYRHYFTILCISEPLDVFMETYYNKLVPNIYIPEPGIMTEVLKAVEVSNAINYIPKIWSDMVTFDHTDRETLITMILNIMVNNSPPTDSNLVEQFANIAMDVWERITNQPEEKSNKISFTGKILGHIITLCLRNGRFDKACVVMDKLDKEQHKVIGVLDIESLSLFIDHCIENKVPTRAINCIQYCVDSGYSEAANLATKLNTALTLDETHLHKLSNIVGSHALLRQKEVIANHL